MHLDMTNLTDRRKRSLSERTVATARQVLAGQRGGLPAYWAFAGPAVIASIAYMDPGNFATNIQAGAKYGYGLLWVVLLANVIAMLFQALSAKLGIVTGRNLAELCRDHFPRPVVWAMWIVSEIAAMATDLAEFLGGAIGLSLLLHMPLFAGMAVTAVVTYGLLDVRTLRLPADRADHRRDGERDRALLPGRDVHRSGRLGIGGCSHLHAAARRRRSPAARGRHHRRNRHAACDLSAFRPDAGADAGSRRRRAAQGAALLQPGSHRRADRRRARQHGHGDDGLERVPRRASRSRGDRNRLSHADAAARCRSGRGVFAVADRLGGVGFDGRNHGRPDDHARLRRVSASRSGCAGW